MDSTTRTPDHDAPRPGRRWLLLGLGGLGIASLAGAAWLAGKRKLWTLDPTDPAITLIDVEREVMRRYKPREVTASVLADLLVRDRAVLFDVRTRDEYEAGHLPGAIRVEPGTASTAFLAAHGGLIGDRPAVFYCAVGVRSSQMMRRLMADITPHAPAGVFNLRGGLFRWASEGRALVAGGEPGRLHPFDSDWEQLLRRSRAGA